MASKKGRRVPHSPGGLGQRQFARLLLPAAFAVVIGALTLLAEGPGGPGTTLAHRDQPDRTTTSATNIGAAATRSETSDVAPDDNSASTDTTTNDPLSTESASADPVSTETASTKPANTESTDTATATTDTTQPGVDPKQPSTSAKPTTVPVQAPAVEQTTTLAPSRDSTASSIESSNSAQAVDRTDSKITAGKPNKQKGRDKAKKASKPDHPRSTNQDRPKRSGSETTADPTEQLTEQTPTSTDRPATTSADDETGESLTTTTEVLAEAASSTTVTTVGAVSSTTVLPVITTLSTIATTTLLEQVTTTTTEPTASTSTSGTSTSGTSTSGTSTSGTSTSGTTSETPAPSTTESTGGHGDRHAEALGHDQPTGYTANLARIRSSSVRNTNHDNSNHRDTPQRQLVIDNHLGPRSEYLNNPGGNSEQAFPTLDGGNFRVSCEFSHFAYDDPLIHPNKPGAAHLHMFWGNTDVNAFSTYGTLINSGGGTCNGQELNRSGYWAPALFDANGNVRIPMRIDVYYKGYGLARQNAEVYPPGAAKIAKNIHEIANTAGGLAGPGGEKNFVCTDRFRSHPRTPADNRIPVCGDTSASGLPTVLEHHIKFQNCLYGSNPADPDSWDVAVAGSWFYADCRSGRTFPHIEYIIQYPLEPGESTAGWHLSSDVNHRSGQVADPGSSNHGDWWGGWQPEVNRMWIENCTTYRTDKPSGCGQGYLTDGGPDGLNPYPGPALKLRPQYRGPNKVKASVLFNELCDADHSIANPAEAAYCTPAHD